MTPYQYLSQQTVAVLPEYSNLNYTNKATIKIEKLDSYTPYMIMVTARNSVN